jgi:hypothetical protein
VGVGTGVGVGVGAAVILTFTNALPVFVVSNIEAAMT